MSELLDKGIAFAVQAHAGQVRKADFSPYILHPLEAGVIAGSITQDEEVIVAALLHDTVEDTSTTIEDIRSAFGDRVAELVGHETENKREGIPPAETWKIRKLETLEILKNSGEEVCILWLADKLSNIRALYRNYLKCGDRAFDVFNQKDKNEQAWYYTTIAEYLAPLSHTTAYTEYVDLVHKIFDK